MATIEKSIEVDAPLRTVYNQWTQFEEFPRFMEGVEEVRQLDDRRLHWSAEVGGAHKEWYARITRQVPDEVIAWESEGDAPNAGEVSFIPLDDGRTEVHLRLDYEPEGLKEQIGDALGVVSRQVEGDLKRFKEFVEKRGVETGAWRGSVDPTNGHVTGTTGRYAKASKEQSSSDPTDDEVSDEIPDMLTSEQVDETSSNKA